MNYCILKIEKDRAVGALSFKVGIKFLRYVSTYWAVESTNTRVLKSLSIRYKPCP